MSKASCVAGITVLPQAFQLGPPLASPPAILSQLAKVAILLANSTCITASAAASTPPPPPPQKKPLLLQPLLYPSTPIATAATASGPVRLDINWTCILLSLSE